MTHSATMERAVDVGQRPSAIRIAEVDNVAVALRPIAAGERINVGDRAITARQDIAPGPKVALADVSVDEQIV